LPGIVEPRYAEHDDAFGFYHSFQDAGLLIFGMLRDGGTEGFEYFLDCLEKLGFCGVLAASDI
jgi:hypothetical protein